MKFTLAGYSIAAIICLLFLGTSGCATESKSHPTETEITASTEIQSPSTPEIQAPSSPEVQACRIGTDPDNLKFNFNLISVIEARSIKSAKLKDPGSDFDPTEFVFAAGNISDREPFISIHRECWAHFFEAKQLLEVGNIKQAAESADDWQGCLRSLFPDHLEVANPYLECFGTKIKTSNN